MGTSRTSRDGADALKRLAKFTEGGYAGLARRLNVSRQTVSAWANRRTLPTLPSIRRMARRLGISVRAWDGATRR